MNTTILEAITNEKEQDVLIWALPRLSMPTLMLWGANDRIIDVSCVQAARQAVSVKANMSSVVYEKCGHSIQTDRVRDVVRHMLGHIINLQVPTDCPKNSFVVLPPLLAADEIRDAVAKEPAEANEGVSEQQVHIMSLAAGDDNPAGIDSSGNNVLTVHID